MKNWPPSHTFCSLPWTHQFIDPTGRVKPCCRFEEKFRPHGNTLTQKNLNEIFDQDWMNNIRSKMLFGEKVNGCTRCYEEEQAGKKSLRQRYNDSKLIPSKKIVNINKPKIKWLEIGLSNTCNLACRMCDSRYSSKWYDEEKKSFGSTYAEKKSYSTPIEQIRPFLNDLIHIKFTGGEPLLMPEHWKLIELLIQSGSASNVYLNYSTNSTIPPKKEWVEKWKKFSHVELALSLDSINENESNYIRWPSQFDHVIKVAKSFLKLQNDLKFTIILRSTVSILNVYSLPRTIKWWIENSPIPLETLSINPTHLSHPNFLSITTLPEAIKEEISQHYHEEISKFYFGKFKKPLQYILEYMNSKQDQKNLVDLKKYLIKTDNYRNQNFSHLYPQYQQLFKDIPYV